MPLKQRRNPSGRLRSVLSQNLLRLRRERELSQEGLAELSGLHRTYVGSVERCERNVTLSSLEAFADALGVSVSDLLSQSGHGEGEHGYSTSGTAGLR